MRALILNEHSRIFLEVPGFTAQNLRSIRASWLPPLGSEVELCYRALDECEVIAEMILAESLCLVRSPGSDEILQRGGSVSEAVDVLRVDYCR